MFDAEYQQIAVNSIARAAETTKEDIRWTLACYEAPSAIYRPRIFMDGDQWCALYGDNLQDGVAGFGTTPAKAMADFDKNWNAEVKP